MTTGNKREVTWYFMPYQTVRLYEGSARVREVLYVLLLLLYTKETVKMSSLCKAGLFFLRRITADPSPWGNFTPPTNSVERPWGILSLFTTCSPLWVKWSRQSRCHLSPTQELIACILRRQSSPISEGLKLKNRTRNKKSAVKDRPMKDPPEELKKLALIIAEINRNTKGRKA